MISPTLTSSVGTSGSGATSAAPLPTQSALSADFETFIKMLTTQAKYQDPLEPLDSSEYAAQLAQFSMVEQQVLSNDLLKWLEMPCPFPMTLCFGRGPSWWCPSPCGAVPL